MDRKSVIDQTILHIQILKVKAILILLTLIGVGDNLYHATHNFEKKVPVFEQKKYCCNKANFPKS